MRSNSIDDVRITIKPNIIVKLHHLFEMKTKIMQYKVLECITLIMFL